MKNLRVLIIATAMTLAAATVTAAELSTGGDYSVKNSTKVVETNAVASKDAAYQLGFSQLKNIVNSSDSQLSKMLPGQIVSGTVHVKGSAYVTVLERMNTSGQIEYIGQVSVPFHYQVSGNSN